MFKRGSVWHTCIRDKGRKIQKRLDSDKELAKDLETILKGEIVKSRLLEKFFNEPKNKLEESVGEDKTFKDMMKKFMNEHAPKVSSKMQESYTISLKHLIPFFGDSKLPVISRKTISRYKVLRRDEGAAPATINKELAMLSKAFNLVVEEWEWLKDKPFSKIQREKMDNERDRWLIENEETELLKNCPGWLSEIVIFALNTGLRKDELLSLEWSRVDSKRKTILIKKTKNGKPKTLPLNRIALDVLERRSKVRTMKNELVFFDRKGAKINGYNLSRVFSETAKKAGIKDFKFHDLRHTFATRLAQAGIEIYKISKLLGHKDISMTQRYAHHCPESLRDGVEILESDYNLTTSGKEVSQNLT